MSTHSYRPPQLSFLPANMSNCVDNCIVFYCILSRFVCYWFQCLCHVSPLVCHYNNLQELPCLCARVCVIVIILGLSSPPCHHNYLVASCIFSLWTVKCFRLMLWCLKLLNTSAMQSVWGSFFISARKSAENLISVRILANETLW